MKCVIYKGHKQADSYLYLPSDADAFEQVPESLTQLLGQCEEIMRLDLHAGLSLAQADVHRVMVALTEQGYYLQMPPHPAVSRSGLNS